MCGVFHFTRETFQELNRQADIITDNIREIREKDIRPSELTTAANDSMKDVHDRMPLILNDDMMRDWIRNDDMVEEYLAKDPPMLGRYQEYEQLTLF